MLTFGRVSTFNHLPHTHIHTHIDNTKVGNNEQLHLQTITCCYLCFGVATWYFLFCECVLRNVFTQTLPGTLCNGISLLVLCNSASEYYEDDVNIFTESCTFFGLPGGIWEAGTFKDTNLI